jgi:hypothetical protein
MKKRVILFTGLGLVLGMVTAQASMQDPKTYNEAYPNSKIKCIDCHVDAMPKNDKGKHNLNAYGKAVVKATGKAKVRTAATYKKVGKVEDFKKK